ncbi:MAG: penicillin-binding protein 2 [Lachnospiraceae bacterium]|nr:penicillin-binding protein 2 [Lachnospiraceae bacterium]
MSELDENELKIYDSLEAATIDNPNRASKQAKKKEAAKKAKQKMNSEMMAVVYFFMLLFFSLAGYLVYYNTQDKEILVNNTYNKRIEVMESETIRGSILASDGTTVLAETVTLADGTEDRTYPYANMFSHVIGFTYKGKSGIEKLANFYLISSNDNPINQVQNDLNGLKNQGDSVVTTLDIGLQKACYSALGNNQGSIVCIEPSTGKILAMVSKPDYDPNTLELIWDTVVNEEEFDSILVNRSTQGLYPPGSTFKVFTLLEYIRQHKDYEDFTYDCNGSKSFEGVTVNCIYGKAHGHLTLKDALAQSCNSAFATMGLSLDKELFAKHCNELLFNSELPLEIEYNPSSFTLKLSSDTEETMQTAFGQGETLMTPIHNCMMAAAIANDGVLMKPYLMQAIVNASGSTIKKFSSEKYKTLMTKEEASVLTEYMTAVITEGTGTALKTNDYTAAGKTGSAEHDNTGSHHSWFIGFAPVEDPQIAICVLLEDGYTGYHSAVDCARIVLDTYLTGDSDYTSSDSYSGIYEELTHAATE